MKKERLIVFVLFSILLVSFLSFVVSAQDEVESQIKEFLELPVIKQIIMIVFGNPIRSIEATFESFAGAPLGDVGVIIIHLMIWLILFVAFSDIFGTFLPFTNKYVPWFVGFGMAVIVANFGFIPKLIGWGAAITAGFGAAAIFVAMFVAFAGFVAVTFFGNWLKVRILKTKINLAGQVGAAKSAAGVKGYAEGYKAFKEASKE